MTSWGRWGKWSVYVIHVCVCVCVYVCVCVCLCVCVSRSSVTCHLMPLPQWHISALNRYTGQCSLILSFYTHTCILPRNQNLTRTASFNFNVNFNDALSMEPIMDNGVQTLSGGELQRCAIVLCLGTAADIYLVLKRVSYALAFHFLFLLLLPSYFTSYILPYLSSFQFILF